MQVGFMTQRKHLNKEKQPNFGLGLVKISLVNNNRAYKKLLEDTLGAIRNQGGRDYCVLSGDDCYIAAFQAETPEREQAIVKGLRAKKVSAKYVNAADGVRVASVYSKMLNQLLGDSFPITAQNDSIQNMLSWYKACQTASNAKLKT